ncbi:hypothetical protein CRG98_017837 [Punica granatum]|uniref:Uncharacterized protein n=1 Tax=Punica granatum TaxID=22663 RepID=A0A2I0JZN1_PUNGR|nr:hypothetical protein CRG98_017837 [Punica granatum]
MRMEPQGASPPNGLMSASYDKIAISNSSERPSRRLLAPSSDKSVSINGPKFGHPPFTALGLDTHLYCFGFGHPPFIILGLDTHHLLFWGLDTHLFTFFGPVNPSLLLFGLRIQDFVSIFTAFRTSYPSLLLFGLRVQDSASIFTAFRTSRPGLRVYLYCLSDFASRTSGPSLLLFGLRVHLYYFSDFASRTPRPSLLLFGLRVKDFVSSFTTFRTSCPHSLYFGLRVRIFTAFWTSCPHSLHSRLRVRVYCIPDFGSEISENLAENATFPLDSGRVDSRDAHPGHDVAQVVLAAVSRVLSRRRRDTQKREPPSAAVGILPSAHLHLLRSSPLSRARPIFLRFAQVQPVRPSSVHPRRSDPICRLTHSVSPENRPRTGGSRRTAQSGPAVLFRGPAQIFAAQHSLPATAQQQPS